MKLSKIIKLLETVKDELGDIDYDEHYDVGICTQDRKHCIGFNTFHTDLMRDKEFIYADGHKWMYDANDNIVKIY